MTNKEKIKYLYGLVYDKSTFRTLVAIKFGVQEVTVRVGWFYKFDLPSKYELQENLITFMENYIAQQSKNKRSKQIKNRK